MPAKPSELAELSAEQGVVQRPPIESPEPAAQGSLAEKLGEGIAEPAEPLEPWMHGKSEAEIAALRSSSFEHRQPTATSTSSQSTLLQPRAPPPPPAGEDLSGAASKDAKSKDAVSAERRPTKKRAVSEDGAAAPADDEGAPPQYPQAPGGVPTRVCKN